MSQEHVEASGALSRPLRRTASTAWRGSGLPRSTGEPREFIDAGDRVVVAVHASGRAKRSGLETTLDYAVVYTVEEGEIIRGREYATRADALEAVALRE